MRFTAAVAAALVLCLHALAWPLSQSPVPAPPVDRFQSVSLTPYEPYMEDTLSGGHAEPARIRTDLAALSRITREVRTYSATRGMEAVPELAGAYGLKVHLGIWLDKDRRRNEEEIQAAIASARADSVASIVVGNEPLLRDELSAEELIGIVRRVKAGTGKPVTVGEVWSVWFKHPALVAEVDYIAAHMLAYWDLVPPERAVDWAFTTYGDLQKAYPGKDVVIAEFGWPSAGNNLHGSFPGAVSQAWLLREFASRAEAAGIRYNLVEGIDQPWKVREGSVGPHWGILDADREPKFPFVGPIETPLWRARAGGALLFSLLLSLPLLWMRRPRVLQALLAAVAVNGVGAWLSAVAIEAFFMGYADWKGRAASILGFGFLLVLSITSLGRIAELLSCLFGRGPERLLRTDRPVARRKVSIHIPVCQEPASMLRHTLDSVAALREADFECIVVVNNTPDGDDKEAIRAHCAALGERFLFIDAGSLEGFKAGALNVALARTAPDVEVVAVLDADYAVAPLWLARTLHAFDDPAIGVVQAPQDHRDGGRSRLHGWMNAEYAGFFDVSMVERNELDAIVVHGTMCQIRRSALEAVGGWPTDTICEDTDLGLYLTEAGWKTLYTAERLGYGLLPDTYESFRKQRHRWAFGGMQIALKHLGSMFSRDNRMSASQKRAFLLGWTSWMGSEAAGLLLALLNIFWAFHVLSRPGVALPSLLLTLPLAAVFVLQLVHFHLTYAARVKGVPLGQRLGASVLSLSLQSTIARAVAEALVLRHIPFVRTAKGGSRGRKKRPYFDMVMAAGLFVASWRLFYENWNRVVELRAFAFVVVLQLLPFLAASVFGTRKTIVREAGAAEALPRVEASTGWATLTASPSVGEAAARNLQTALRSQPPELERAPAGEGGGIPTGSEPPGPGPARARDDA